MGATRTDRKREGWRLNERSQYEVIMTMKVGLGVHVGCAVEEKTVHDERVNGMDQNTGNLQDGHVISEQIMVRTCFGWVEQSLRLRLK